MRVIPYIVPPWNRGIANPMHNLPLLCGQEEATIGGFYEE
jgi:hypothetical protein